VPVVVAHDDGGNLWGIGPRYARFLKSDGEADELQPDLWGAAGLEPVLGKRRVETALDLKTCLDTWVRKHLTIKGLRLVWELRGISCLLLEVFEKPRKGLCCSLSFGRPVTTLEDLKESVAMHCPCDGEKLRRQRLGASHLTVFISTSRFRQNPEEIYSGAASLRLPFPTNYRPGLASAAHSLLERVYKPGFVYHKAGLPHGHRARIGAAAERARRDRQRAEAARHVRRRRAQPQAR